MKSKFLLSLFVGLFYIANSQVTKESDSIKRLANSNYMEGNFERAGELYDLYISKFETDASTLYNASCCWSLSGQKQKALDYLNKAFSYGFYNIQHASSDPDLNNIKDTHQFRTIIEKEREFQADSIITLTDVVKALLERDVAVFKNKRFVIERKEWFHYETKLIDDIIKEVNDDRIIKSQGKINFSNKSLIIQECSGQIYLEGLKLKAFTIFNYNEPIKRKNLNEFSVIELIDLHLNSFSFSIKDFDYVRLFSVTANNIPSNNLANIERFSLRDSDITLFTQFFDSNYHTAFGEMGTLNDPVNSILITNTIFRDYKKAPSVIFMSVNTNDFYFTNNTIEGEIAFPSSSFGTLTMVDNDFQKGVDFTNSKLPSSNFYVKFDQFKAGLGVHDGGRDWEIAQHKLLMTGEEGEIDDVKAYDQLIYSYRQFFDNFRERGDIQSANASYSKLKEIMLRKDRLVYVRDKTFQNFMTYRLNWLLKILSNNGTSPAKTIVISGLIILLFSFVYVFFPSDWDRKSKQKIMKDYKLLREKNEHGTIKPLGYLISDLILTWLNAVMLSLNAFVTLGFGAIPTRGVARYLCIIQGFIGWFLLSIFTVALVNQVLI